MANTISQTANQPNRLRSAAWAALKAFPRWIGRIVIGVAVIAFLAFVLTSFFNTAAAIDDDVPRSWNASIEKLGITPLYPPQEDFYVGDVILAVTPAKRKFKSLPDDLQVDAIKGRSIRIGHIDLLKYMQRPGDVRYFGDSKRDENGTLSIVQPRREADIDPADNGKIVLSSLLFPAIRLEHSASVNGVWQRLGFGASSASAEKIVLSHVQSYGADAYTSTALLARFCADPATRGFCIEKSARAQLSYMMGDDILKTAPSIDNKPSYIFEIRVFVVYRVYLARGMLVGGGDGINTRLFSSEAGSMDVTEVSSPDVGVDHKPEERADEADVEVQPKVKTEAPPASSASRSDKRIFLTDEPFNRPLAFGYRSVSFGMREQ
ncbi:hypothetical protein ACCS42_09155 [Rhizobium ruizarguesonis]